MILITGATGNVGQELVAQLLELKQAVRVFVRDERKVAYLGNRIERAVGDLDRPETLAAAMQGVDRMYLMTYETQQDINVLAAAKSAGVKHIVKLSTLEANIPELPIGVWHHDREQLIEASGLTWTFLRPGQFTSNALQWARTIKQQSTVYASYGEGKVAPIDPRDIAAVAAIALTQPGHTGQIYELTGPELVTTREQVAILAGVLGKSLRHVEIPPLAAKEQMLQHGMPPAVAEALTDLAIAVREGKAEQYTDTVEKVTGCPPRPFEVWCCDHRPAFS